MPDDTNSFPAGALDIIKSLVQHTRDDVSRYKISVQCAVPKGQNYLGVIYRVTVTGENTDGELLSSYIVKVAIGDEALRVKLPITIMYEREILFYTELLPLYKQMQTDAGIPSERHFKYTECYHIHREYLKEFLILEDLERSGFRTLNRMNCIDYEHAQLTLNTLGKCHALSFVLKIRQPEKFHYFSKQLNDLIYNGDDWVKSFNKYAFQKALEIVKDENHKKALNRYKDNIVDCVRRVIEPDEYSVLSHSDSWINNMMFRYEGGKPTEVRLIDYQIGRYGPPAADILFFMFTSTGQQLRRAHYEDMLRAYHNSMKNHLKAFSYDIDDIYPWTVFKDELKRISIFGLSVGLCSVIIATTEGDSTPSTSEMTDLANSAAFKQEPSQDYKARVIGTLEDYFSYGYLTSDV